MAKKIIGLLQPFDLKQNIYVYENGNKIEIIETKVDNFTSEMLQLINKYKIEDIELAGPKKYTKGIGTKVQEEYIKNSKMYKSLGFTIGLAIVIILGWKIIAEGGEKDGHRFII